MTCDRVKQTTRIECHPGTGKTRYVFENLNRQRQRSCKKVYNYVYTEFC